MEIKKEFLRFAKSTTIKGLPRIFNSETFFLRMLWAIAVTCGFTTAVFMVFCSLQDYFLYQTVINVRSEATNPPFPDVSVCKTHDFNIQSFANISGREYIANLQILCKKYPTVFTDDVFEVASQVYGYFENVAQTIARISEELKENFIVKCQWIIGHRKYIPCNMSNIMYFKTPEFIRCFTFKGLQEVMDGKLEGVSIIFYMDDVVFGVLPLPDLTFHKTMSYGFRVDIHPPGESPNMFRALTFPVAHETSFRIRTNKRELLPEPYGKCTKEKYMKFKGRDILDHTYSQSYCYEICHQTMVIAKCGCLDVQHAASNEMMEKYSYCGLILDNLTITAERIKCRMTMTYDDQNCNCLEPCDKLYYTHSVGIANWPHEAFHLRFYDTYIRNKPHNDNFEFYADLLKQFGTGITSDAEKFTFFEKLKKAEELKRNFAQLNVFFEDNKVVYYRDEIAVTVSMLFANIGGTMNLWIGITFCTVIEILEIIYRLLCPTGNKKPTLKTITMNNNKFDKK